MDLEKYKDIQDKDRPLVIIDSGVGGLNILKKISDLYPIENFVYICENEMLPLGNKNVKILNRRMNKIIKSIKEINPKGILIACNTIDSISGDLIRSSFPYINVYGIIEATVNKALELTKSKKIALLATKNTVESQSYMHYALSKKGIELYGAECINLAKAIELNEDVKKVFVEESSILDGIEFDTLILGCTHYSVIKNNLVKKKYGDINIVDSSDELVNNYELNENIAMRNKANKQEIEIFLTKENDEIFLENVKNKGIKNYIISNIKI